jgi:MinD-like ATPase involved in chromosome partitioning or flagellar assembly
MDNDANKKREIAVVAGKGGVGKSTISSNIAMALAALGQNTTYVDRDYSGLNGQIIFRLFLNNATFMNEFVDTYKGIKDEYSEYEKVVADHLKSKDSSLLDKVNAVVQQTKNENFPELVASLLNKGGEGYTSLSASSASDVEAKARQLTAEDVKAGVSQKVIDKFLQRADLEKLVNPTNMFPGKLSAVVGRKSNDMSNFPTEFPDLYKVFTNFFESLKPRDSMLVNDFGAGTQDYVITPFADSYFKVIVVNQDEASMSSAKDVLKQSIEKAIENEFAGETVIDKKVRKVADENTFDEFVAYFKDGKQLKNDSSAQIEEEIVRLMMKKETRKRINAQADTKDLDSQIESLTEKAKCDAPLSSIEKAYVCQKIDSIVEKFDNVYVVMNKVGVDSEKVGEAKGYLKQLIADCFYDLGISIKYFGKDGLTKYAGSKKVDASTFRNEIYPKGCEAKYTQFLLTDVSADIQLNEANLVRESDSMKGTINGTDFITVYKRQNETEFKPRGKNDSRNRSDAQIEASLTHYQLVEDVLNILEKGERK